MILFNPQEYDHYYSSFYIQDNKNLEKWLNARVSLCELESQGQNRIWLLKCAPKFGRSQSQIRFPLKQDRRQKFECRCIRWRWSYESRWGKEKLRQGRKESQQRVHDWVDCGNRLILAVDPLRDREEHTSAVSSERPWKAHLSSFLWEARKLAKYLPIQSIPLWVGNTTAYS